MKLLKLFTKKTEKEVVENVKMTELIVFLMTEYLKSCQGDIVLVREEPELEKEYGRLESLGLGNSENAKILRQKIQEIQSKKDRKEFGESVVEFIKDLGIEFPSSYLISFDQFYQIIQKYHLYCKPISYYTGIIPQKNIDEIGRVKEILTQKYDSLDSLARGDYKRLPLNLYRANDRIYSSCFWYVSKLKYSGDRESTASLLVKYIENYGSFVRCRRDYGTSETIALQRISENEQNYWTMGINKILGKNDNEFNYSLDVRRLKPGDLMIAAPENCFEKDYKVEKIPVDPIVFQCSPFGVIIHSVWGEEADDKVLAEYKELNRKILEG